MMTDALLQSVLKLSKAERILLAEQLWDSVADPADAPPLTPGQIAELDRRLARLRKTGPQGRPWPQIKKEITGRRKP